MLLLFYEFKVPLHVPAAVTIVVVLVIIKKIVGVVFIYVKLNLGKFTLGLDVDDKLSPMANFARYVY